MKEINLRGGKIALVDDEDFDLLKQYKWDILKSKNNPHVLYARVGVFENGEKKNILMHRLILQPKDNQLIDHIDRDGLNNQKGNLRFCTRSQNAANKKVQKGSKFKGVRRRYPIVKYKSKRTGEIKTYTRPESYLAFITKNGKAYYGGEYSTQEAAALAYNNLALEHYGEFALLNSV